MSNVTDSNIKEMVEVLSKNRDNEDIIKVDESQKYSDSIDNSNMKLEEGTAEYISDGVIMENEDNDDFNHFENLESNIDDIIEDQVKTNLSNKYDLNDDDALNLLMIIKKVRNNEKIDVYNNLPESIKNHINKIAEEQNIPKANKNKFLHFMADSIISEFINDMEIDALSIDFEKALAELVPTPAEMYSETNRDYIENEFLKVAEKLQENNPNQAKNLLDMRQGYIDAYKFTPLYESLENSKILKNIRRCNKIWSRIDSDYLKVAGVCKFTLYPLSDIHTSLMKIGYTELESMRFITLFVYTYIKDITDYKDESQYNDIYRNSFGNYLENNIKNLAISPNLTSDFSKEIKQNLNNIINTINDKISEKELELSNKKHKKRG